MSQTRNSSKNQQKSSSASSQKPSKPSSVVQQDTGNLPGVSVQQIGVDQAQNTFLQPKQENVEMDDLEEAL